MSDDDVRNDDSDGHLIGDRLPEFNGSSPEQFELADELPLDLVAVQADDALIDELNRAGAGAEVSDEQLARVLVAWRREVDADLGEPLVDLGTALAVVARAQRTVPHRRLRLLPAAAAALAVVAFSGLGLGAREAEPGDGLWPLTKVLYAEHARSVEAAEQVRTELDEALAALENGQPEAAKDALRRAQQDLPAVDGEQGRSDLSAQHETLMERLTGSSGPQADPPAAASSATTTASPADIAGADATEPSTQPEPAPPADEPTTTTTTTPEPAPVEPPPADPSTTDATPFSTAGSAPEAPPPPPPSDPPPDSTPSP